MCRKNKIAAVLLSVLIAFSFLSLFNTTFFAAEKTKTYYFEDVLNWKVVYAYSWYSDDNDNAVVNGTWPGVRMSYLKTDSHGCGIYSIEVPSDMEYIIFTNHRWNSSGKIYDQTVDIPLKNNKYENSIFKLTDVGYYNHRYNGLVPLYNYAECNANDYIYNLSGNLLSQETQDNINFTADNKKIQYNDEKFTDVDVEIESQAKFTVPGEVPIIGGKNIEIDMSSVPIFAKRSNDKIYVGIGYSNSKDLNTGDWDNTWCSIKNYVNGYKSNIEKGKSIFGASKFGRASAGIGKSFDFKVIGYYEGVINNGKIVKGGGLAQLDLSAALTNEWQTAIGAVPVVLKIKGEVSASNEMNLSFDTNECKLNITNNLSLTLPKFNASAGIGVSKIADVSVYGQCENILDINDNFSSLKGTLFGEIGVSAKFLMFSGNVPIIKSKDGWTYYDSTKKNKNTGSTFANIDISKYSIDRKYLDNQSHWKQSEYLCNYSDIYSNYSDVYNSKIKKDYTELQSSVYNNATPKLIDSDYCTMMVWTGDDVNRTTGNQTAIFFSIYDKNKNIWSTPQIVEDDGTADFYPYVASDGENIYIAWTDTNKVFDDDVTVDQMAQSCEIKVAKFNNIDRVFEDIHKITDNENADIFSSITINNGEIIVTWMKRENGNILDADGVNAIYYAKSGENYNPRMITSTKEQVVDLICDKDLIAYISGSANDNSMDVYYIEPGGSQIKLTNDGYDKNNIRFSEINGTKYLTYESGGVIYGTSDMKNIIALTDSTLSIFGEYEFVSKSDTNGNYSVLISNETNGNGSEIYEYFQNSNGLWTNPVCIVKNEKYIRNFSAILNDNNDIQLVYMLTTANITNDSVDESTSLCTQILDNKHDLKLNSVTYDSTKSYDSLLNAKINISNLGSFDENKVTINVVDEEGKLVKEEDIEISLLSGESKSIDFSVPLPDKVENKLTYCVKVLPFDSKDANENNNSFNLEYGFTALQFNVKKASFGEATGIMTIINNMSFVPTDAVLVVRSNSAEGDILDVFNLEDILGNSQKHFFLDYKYIKKYRKTSDFLYLEVISSKSEEAVSDNIQLIDISDISAPRHTSYTIKFDCEEYKSSHNYANNCDETWKIYKEGAESISISFSDLTKTEDDSDYILIYDFNDNLVGKYSGTALAGRTLYIEGNTVVIRLISDSAKNEYGFELANLEARYKLDYNIGDVTFDNEILIDDVTTIQKYLALLVEFDEQQKIVSDIDMNNIVTIKDATLVQKYIVGITSSLIN